MQKIQVKPGSIISGTHREEDLWEAFRPYLPDDEEWVQRGDELYQQLTDNQDMDLADLLDICYELSDIINHEVFFHMNNIAPEGHYFGTHPGDGADFGFWKSDFELPAYTDLGGYPIYYVQEDWNRVLCPDCANELEPEEKEELRDGINWEDPHLYCHECGERIESAYAEDEVEAV